MLKRAKQGTWLFFNGRFRFLGQKSQAIFCKNRPIFEKGVRAPSRDALGALLDPSGMELGQARGQASSLGPRSGQGAILADLRVGQNWSKNRLIFSSKIGRFSTKIGLIFGRKSADFGRPT